jgi:predicted GNAT superfamily acetyltransferase
VTSLDVGPAGEPVGREAEGDPRVLCGTPDDIVAIRRAQPDLARRWREALRVSLGFAFERGYTVAGVTRDGWYVLDHHDN